MQINFRNDWLTSNIFENLKLALKEIAEHSSYRRLHHITMPKGQDSNGNKRSALEEDLLRTDSIFHDS